ncbi:hypothetical protein ACFLY2_01590 [Patescibacteria group bacterium]
MEEINSKPEILNPPLTPPSNQGGEQKENNLYEEAEKYIDIGLELNPKNPMLTLVK